MRFYKTRRNILPYPIYLPNPYLYSNNYVLPTNNEVNETNKDQRFIPFVGGALIGGALGSAYVRPRYYGYPVMYGGYYPYYQNPGYYSVSSYNYGGYPVQQPYTN